METKIIIDGLNQDSVSILKKRYIIDDGKECFVGDPERRAYVNSEVGREMLQENVPEPYISSILAVWGNAPTLASYDDV